MGKHNIPNPGSVKARAFGCTCPVLDNAHGKGRYGDGKRYGWWKSADCPVHPLTEKEL